MRDVERRDRARFLRKIEHFPRFASGAPMCFTSNIGGVSLRRLHQEQTDEDFNLLCRGDLGCSGAGDARSRRECSRLVRELGL
jgi:hypothetical protein